MKTVKMVVVAVVMSLAAVGVGACASEPNDAERVSTSLDASPINELLGVESSLDATDLVELERSAERRVAECMAAAGFEYVAVDFAGSLQPEFGAEDPDSRAYAEANGYGISTRPVIGGSSPQDLVDPNADLVAGLSEAELEAYQLALYGEGPVDGEPLEPSERSGCVAESYQAVYAAQAELGRVERFYGDFASELAALEERFRADPRFADLEAQWAGCMSEQGFEVATRAEIFVELDRRMSDVAPSLVPGEEPDAELQEQIDAVRDFERQIAVADWDCTQPVEAELRALRYGYEELFLQENGDRVADSIDG